MGCNTSKENQGNGEVAENNKETENQKDETKHETEALENHSNGK